MEKYEKTISLKTIWLTIVRRFHIFLIIFIPISLVSFIVTDKLLTKTFVSTVTISRGAAIDVPRYNLILSYVSDTSTNEDKPGAIYTTAQRLKNNDVKHSNGSEITINEIASGISFSVYVAGTVSVTFSFQSYDKTITQKVLNELANVSIEYLKSRAGSDYKDMTVLGNGASPATKNSKERTYFLIALAAGFVVAFAISFIDEIVGDEVYDKYDIEALDCSAFEVKAKPKKKEA